MQVQLGGEDTHTKKKKKKGFAGDCFYTEKGNAKGWYNERTKTNRKMRSCIDPQERSCVEVKGGSGTETSLLLVGVGDTNGHTDDDTNNNDWQVG